MRNYREDGGASFRTYAGVCITNRIIMAYRWAAGRKNFPLNNFVPLSEEGASCGVFAGEEANPEKMLVEEEDLLLLKRFISRGLSKMERQVLMLYLGGYSYKAVSYTHLDVYKRQELIVWWQIRPRAVFTVQRGLQPALMWYLHKTIR